MKTVIRKDYIISISTILIFFLWQAIFLNTSLYLEPIRLVKVLHAALTNFAASPENLVIAFQHTKEMAICRICRTSYNKSNSATILRYAHSFAAVSNNYTIDKCKQTKWQLNMAPYLFTLICIILYNFEVITYEHSTLLWIMTELTKFVVFSANSANIWCDKNGCFLDRCV